MSNISLTLSVVSTLLASLVYLFVRATHGKLIHRVAFLLTTEEMTQRASERSEEKEIERERRRVIEEEKRSATFHNGL